MGKFYDNVQFVIKICVKESSGMESEPRCVVHFRVRTRETISSADLIFEEKKKIKKQFW